ncbi:uncharacterized protein LOC110715914 [Chenopodium quinoa]|uniref:uncharacterized protein LOC110715914 n=1 Tax=Chenopodium quinoa TaxID=63459 RepID=UPI000B796CFE|nr:uncharacterized protein LOC110715914 [Chenopodium quinoa]
MDDIIAIGLDVAYIDQFIPHFASRFSLKDLGSLSYFLGVEIMPTTHGLFIGQHNYITNLLECMGMLDTKPAITPLVVTQTLSANSGFPLEVPKDFRAAVGSLL